MSRAAVFRWHKMFQDGREEVREEERWGRERDVRTPELVDKIRNVRMRTVHQVSLLTECPPRPDGQQRILRRASEGVQKEISSEEARTVQIWSVAPAPGLCTHSQIHPGDQLPDRDGHRNCPSLSLYSSDLASCDFGMFPKLKENLRGRGVATIPQIPQMRYAQSMDALVAAKDDVTATYQRGWPSSR